MSEITELMHSLALLYNRALDENDQVAAHHLENALSLGRRLEG